MPHSRLNRMRLIQDCVGFRRIVKRISYCETIELECRIPPPAPQGGLSLDLSRMTRILEVNDADLAPAIPRRASRFRGGAVVWVVGCGGGGDETDHLPLTPLVAIAPPPPGGDSE